MYHKYPTKLHWIDMYIRNSYITLIKSLKKMNFGKNSEKDFNMQKMRSKNNQMMKILIFLNLILA